MKTDLIFSLEFSGTYRCITYDANNLPNDQWIHLAAVWDRSGIDETSETMRMYVDGEKVASGTYTDWGTSVGYWADICGGNDQNIADKFAMDELKIWNFAKTHFSGRIVADAGPDQIVEQTSPAGADVILNGSGSTDGQVQPLTYAWTWLGGSATGINPTVTLPLGTTTVTLTVNEGQFSDTDTVNITVQDTTPPTISVSVSPDTLWPPNHKYVDITANVTVSDICDPSPTVTLVSVKSNEPDDAKGVGDGNTINDIVIVNHYHFKLRAERDGTGMGRVYTITYLVTDASGNSATTSATVTVPHDRDVGNKNRTLPTNTIEVYAKGDFPLLRFALYSFLYPPVQSEGWTS